MTDETLFLYTTSYEKNKYGVSEPTQSKSERFCQKKPITQSEFYNAGRNGLNPSGCFVIFAGDYNGENLLEYNGEMYSIYRTYPVGDYVELYVERKGGTNGQKSDD